MSRTYFDLEIESLIQDGFYVPIFEVKVDDAELPQNVVRDVYEITYKDNIKELDNFEIKINNWDYHTQKLKYIEPSPLPGQPPPAADPLHSIFDPCAKDVKIVMGYLGDTRVMLSGNFTSIEPSFSANSAPTLTVRGLNMLHQLRRKKTSKTWATKKISQAVKSLEGDLPVPIQIDQNAMAYEEEDEFLAMRNQYPIDFILLQARENDYVAVLQEADPNVPGSRRQLYFGPSQTGISGWTDFSFELEWGKSLIDFTPTLTTANQVRAVTVRGWQRSARSAIEETVTLDDRRLNRNRDLYHFLQKCNPRETIEVDLPVRTRREARRRATNILMDRQKQMVTASGSTVGLADLRAGKKLKIKNVGKTFSGTYFITETTHTINDSGYRTKFKARREDEEGGAS